MEGRELLLLLLLAPVAQCVRIPVRSRRAALSQATAAAAALACTDGAAASKSRSDGYSVQRTEREWSYVLSGQQYYVLRNGGTETPNTSPLVKEKRKGTFVCAACPVALFDSQAKFESGTGWPSFATALPAVETQQVNLAAAALLGAEVRCGECGGHLGDVFLDGLLFPGTPAALSGKRYCTDGAALVFQPADGGEPVSGEGAPPAQPSLPSWLAPPPVGNAS